MSAPRTTTNRLGHQPSLDGIRGIAILAVLAIHFEWPWLPGGFFGVDVFFALSGFLITTLLLEEQLQSGRISLGRFFMRRVLRLYPALVGLVVVSTVFALLFHRESTPGRDFSVAAAVLLYVANWMSMADTQAWFGGMPHTWSLAVEMQFYVLWAAIIAIVSRRYAGPTQRGTLLKVLTVIAGSIVIISATWRAILWAHHANWLRVYLGTDTRLDAIFVGATAALVRLQGVQKSSSPWMVNQPRWVIAGLETICFAVIVLLFAVVHFASPLPGVIDFTIVAIATTVLILTTVLRTDTLFGAIFRLRPLTWIGQISYSLYIWHVPAAKLLRADRLVAAGLPPWAAGTVRVVVAVLLAAVSYYAIERTFLRMKRRFEPRRAAGTSPVAMAASPQAGL